VGEALNQAGVVEVAGSFLELSGPPEGLTLDCWGALAGQSGARCLEAAI